MIIDRFRDDYWFLSNMYPCWIETDIGNFRCAESYFQAMKCRDASEREKFVDVNGYKAKKMGRYVALKGNWNTERLRVMEMVVREKFKQNPDLLMRLKKTGYAELIEGNDWKDTYWGKYKGIGENHLGKILMKIREEL